MQTLRQFLYLDRDLVRDLLAQAEGGVFDETTERSKSTGKGGLGGELGAGPAKIKGEKGKERTVESEAIVKQVAASEFDRLYDYLSGLDLVLLEEADNNEALSEIRRKQFIEVDARIRVAGIQQILDLFGSFADLMPLIEAFGTTEVDQETRDGMKLVSMLNTADKPLPVIGTVAGGANFKVALELRRGAVLSDAWDTEASVLLKVQRIMKGDDRYLVGDPFGGLISMLPEVDRKKLTDSLITDEMMQAGVGETEITAPAVVGTPVAIYR